MKQLVQACSVFFSPKHRCLSAVNTILFFSFFFLVILAPSACCDSFFFFFAAAVPFLFDLVFSAGELHASPCCASLESSCFFFVVVLLFFVIDPDHG